MNYPEWNSTETYEVAARVMFQGIQYLKTVTGDDTPPGTEGSVWRDEIAMRSEVVNDKERYEKFCLECEQKAQQLLDSGNASLDEIKSLLQHKSYIV